MLENKDLQWLIQGERTQNDTMLVYVLQKQLAKRAIMLRAVNGDAAHPKNCLTCILQKCGGTKDA